MYDVEQFEIPWTGVVLFGHVENGERFARISCSEKGKRTQVDLIDYG